MRVATRMGRIVASTETATTTTRAIDEGPGAQHQGQGPAADEVLRHRLGQRQARALVRSTSASRSPCPTRHAVTFRNSVSARKIRRMKLFSLPERPHGPDLPRALDDADDERVHEDEGHDQEDQARGEVDEGLEGGGDPREEPRSLVPAGRLHLEALRGQPCAERGRRRVVLQPHGDHRVARDRLRLQRRGVDRGARGPRQREDVVLALLRGGQPLLQRLGQRAAGHPGEVVHPRVGGRCRRS